MMETYHFLKAAEGGPSQRQVLSDLKAAGLRVKAASSPYVGHTAVTVYGSKRAQRKAERLIFNK